MKPLLVILLLITTQLNFLFAQCPIQSTECSTVRCTGTKISCENDSSVVKVPTFGATSAGWTELVIRFTNIKQISADSFNPFSNMSSILLVDLSNNQIESIELNAFSPFRNSIKKLILSNNKLLAFTFETYLAVSLEQLFLDSNNIADFTVNVNSTTTTMLTNLYLNQNDLNILPIDIKQLVSLTYLDLSFNPLVNLPRYSFNTLSTLTTLKLNGLDELSCLNVDTFSGLSSLISLYLSAPTQIGLRPDICWFTHLDSLKEFLYDTSKLLVNQNLQTYDYCNDQQNSCWLYVLTVLKKMLVRNPLTNAQSYCSVNESYVADKNACVNSGCSLTTCEPGSYETAGVTTTATTTTRLVVAATAASNTNLPVILGSVFGVMFFLLIIVFIMCVCFIRKKMYCFKEEDGENELAKNNVKKKDEFDGKKNSTVNPLFFGKNNKAYLDDDDDDLNNIGAIINIVELSDHSLSNTENTTNTPDDADDDGFNSGNRNVRFDSNVMIINKVNADNSVSFQDESDMIATIYEDDEENAVNKSSASENANNEESVNNSNDFDNTRL